MAGKPHEIRSIKMTNETKKKKTNNATVNATAKGAHQNAARAALVISTIAKAGPQGLRFTDVIDDSGLGVSTVHRLLNGLVEYGFIDLDQEKNRYFIGMQMVAWAATATERYGLAPFVEASLQKLLALTEDTVYFSIISGHDAICLDRLEGAFPVRVLTLQVGDRRPLGAGAGSLALLSFQSEDIIKAVLDDSQGRLKQYGITPTYLQGAIKSTVKSGYSINKEKIVPGMSAVGIPIKNEKGQAVAAISIAAITSRLNGKRLEKIIKWLKTEANVIERDAAEVLNTSYIKRFSSSKQSR